MFNMRFLHSFTFHSFSPFSLRLSSFNCCVYLLLHGIEYCIHNWSFKHFFGAQNSLYFLDIDFSIVECDTIDHIRITFCCLPFLQSIIVKYSRNDFHSLLCSNYEYTKVLYNIDLLIKTNLLNLLINRKSIDIHVSKIIN